MVTLTDFPITILGSSRMNILYPNWKSQILIKGNGIQIMSSNVMQPESLMTQKSELLASMNDQLKKELADIRIHLMKEKMQFDKLSDVKKNINSHSYGLIEMLTFKVMDLYEKLDLRKKTFTENKTQAMNKIQDITEVNGENRSEDTTKEDGGELTQCNKRSPKRKGKPKQESYVINR